MSTQGALALSFALSAGHTYAAESVYVSVCVCVCEFMVKCTLKDKHTYNSLACFLLSFFFRAHVPHVHIM